MVLDIISFFSANPILFHSIVVILSLALLAKSSSLMITGISNYSKKIGLSDYVVGLFVVGFTASIPELLAGISGLAFASSDVIFGTIFGSNIMGITLVIGVLAIFGKNLPVTEKVFDKTRWDMVLLIALPFILMFDGNLSFFDGLILFTSFIIYITLLWRKEGQEGNLVNKVELKTIYKDGLIFLLSFIVLTFSSLLLVNSSLHLSELLNLSELLVALVVIGIGAQLPDLLLGIHAIRKGHESVAIGVLVGSVVIKASLFMGGFAVFRTLSFGIGNVVFTGVLTIFSVILLFHFVKNNSLTRKEGLVLVGLFAVFFIGQLFFA